MNPRLQVTQIALIAGILILDVALMMWVVPLSNLRLGLRTTNAFLIITLLSSDIFVALTVMLDQ